MDGFKKIIKFFSVSIFLFCLFINVAEAATCGSANGKSTVTVPTANLCSDGTSPHVLGTTSVWTWTCGSTACSAPDPNASYKAQFAATEMPSYAGLGSSPDTTEVWLQYFCSWGVPSDIPAFQKYDLLSCTYGDMGSHGGCTGCVMSRYSLKKKASSSPVNGKCGSANGGTFSSLPMTNLCSAGTSGTVGTSSSSYVWSCYGLNGGSNASCFAYMKVNGVCGSANGKTYAYNATSYGSDTQCHIGSSSNTAFPVQNGSVAWTCSGINGGASASCSASRAAVPLPTYDSVIVSSSFPTTMKAGEKASVQITVRNTGTMVWTESFQIRLGGVGDGSGVAAKFGSARIYLPGGTTVPMNGQYTFTFNITAPSTVGTYNLQYRMLRESVTWFGATKAATINVIANSINGVCGSSNSKTFSSAPTSGLCSAGTASTVKTNSTTYTWKCTGSNGGTSSSCSAKRKRTGVCGTANNKTYAYDATGYGTDTQCTIGTPSTTSLPAPGTTLAWTCSGINGGASTVCSASRAAVPVNGFCGSANGHSFYSKPVTDLCVTGIASAVSGSGPWTWTCNGINGGTSKTCSATKKTDGICGTANNKTYAYDATGYGTDTQCSLGTPSTTLFPYSGSAIIWTCSGTNGGISASCSANRAATPINGACGTANNKTYAYDATGYGTDTQCIIGTPSTTLFPAEDAAATWTCSGINGGISASCSANRAAAPINGACGTANNKTYAYDATGYGTDTQCTIGTPSTTSFPAQGATSAWTCSGTNGGISASCSANRAAAPINGVCGSADGKDFSSIPTVNLCNAGIPSVVTGLGPWTWTCNGTNGGTNDSCAANKVISGLCGSSEGGIYSVAPVVGLCFSGAASSAVWNGTNWAWTCRSCDGGSADLCYAHKSTISICGTSHNSILYSVPTANLCNIGIASNVSGSGPWTWTCDNGSGIPITSCSANKAGATCYFCCQQ